MPNQTPKKCAEYYGAFNFASGHAGPDGPGWNQRYRQALALRGLCIVEPGHPDYSQARKFTMAPLASSRHPEDSWQKESYIVGADAISNPTNL